MSSNRNGSESRQSSIMRFSKSSRRRGNSQEANYGSSAHNGAALLGTSPSYSGRNTISAAPGKGFSSGSATNFSSSGGPRGAQSPSYAKSDEGGAGAFASSKTGFLTKRAMSSMDAFANWKERFFVLAEGHLSYYKQGGGFFNSGKEDIAHLKGELELTPDSIVRKSTIDDKANCFEVVTPAKKMFAQASTAKEMEDWVKCIRAHISALQRPPQGRSSFHDASPPFSAATAAGGGGGSGGNGGSGGGAMAEDYSRPSMLEDHEIVRGAGRSTDPKDVVIKQLLDENRQLREQLILKDQVIYELEMNGGRSLNAPAPGASAKIRHSAPVATLDLRDVKKKQFQLFDAAEVGNWHMIATLLRDNVVDVNGVGINQTTALHLAAKMNHPNAVKELLARSADHSARNGDSYTPLHLAVQAGNVGCVEELLNAGADPNTTDYQGNGAIHMTAETGNIAIAKLLVASGARIDAPNASGSLPVHLSPIGHPIRVLLGSGANLAATNPSQPPKPQKDGRENDTQVSHLAFKNKYQKDLALGPRDFEFVKVLGRGAFAKVYLVRGKGSNRDKWYALKAYNKQAIVQKNQAQYIHTEKAALQAHGFALDWYSVGALLFELLTGLPPFYTNDKKQLFHNILRGHLVIPDHLSPNARDLIQRLLHRDPKQRLGSGPTGDREIFAHPFFNTVDWERLKRRELPPPFRPKITADPTGVPDTSNFPQAFTDQDISDIERGFELSDPNAKQIQRPGASQKDDRRLFKDFDFTPELPLDSEAKQFEQLALQQNSFKNLPAPALVEADEYSI
ncbi:hypothetical protein PybrP1_005373 [[Pythium] brassicae (nom. inval.)]|nr:hypothetical protein PybrP1_005373 [[Pythium] brassicae (nom. inval.)]